MQPVVPLLSDLAPDGFDFSGQYMVEFDADSLWYETSLTIAARALEGGFKTEYHVFEHFPREARQALTRLGVDAARLEADGLLNIWDSYTETTEFEKARTTGPGWEMAGPKPLDIVQGAARWVERTKKGFDPREMRWLHLDDNTGIFLQYNDEQTVVDRWRTALLPAIRARECPHFLAFPKGIASEAFYTKFEALCDGIIDLKTEEVEGQVERFLRIRRLKGRVADSHWHRLEMQADGAVRLGHPPSLGPARRLAAIMFTDMVGSTRAAQEDEASALELIRAQEELLRPRFSAHQGRVIKSLGDGFLVVFDSALRAVQCAVDIQQAIRSRNAGSGTRPIQLRIGVHLGDIEERGSDVFGDSVNIAARIEPLADPEGICITEPVFGQVQNKITNRFEKLEPQTLKDVRFPVDVYRMRMSWDPGPALAATWDPRRVAVMPLVNMIPDPSEAYFADGMTEEIISAISKVRDLAVISRTSVTQYKNTTKKVAEIARDLNVGTLLEGSVRKAGNRVRIAVQLIDANSDKHLWSENYDRTLDDVFSIQSEIAQGVASRLQVTLLDSDRKRLERAPTRDPEAHAFFLKGRAAHGPVNAIEFYRKAVEKDPRYALAHAWLAIATLNRGFSDIVPALDAAREAESSLQQALVLDPALPEAHAARAFALYLRWDFEGAQTEANRALELDPNSHEALAYGAFLLRLPRRFEESEKLVRRALELDPLSPATLRDAGTDLLYLGRPEEAAALFKTVLEIEPEEATARGNLGLACVQQGLLDQGVAMIRDGIRMSGGIEVATACDLSYALRKADRLGELREFLTEVLAWYTQRGYGATALVAVYANLGELDPAFEWFGRALDEHSAYLPTAVFDFAFENLWPDPRFESLKERLGLR